MTPVTMVTRSKQDMELRLLYELIDDEEQLMLAMVLTMTMTKRNGASCREHVVSMSVIYVIHRFHLEA
jgi:hypothetical protein